MCNEVVLAIHIKTLTVRAEFKKLKVVNHTNKHTIMIQE
jgi:hypothetical protein